MLAPRLAHVFPRKKRGESRRFQDHVSISLEDIMQLSHLRQADAARTMGISLTAFKSACRQLGLTRWPYSRQAEGQSNQETHQRLVPWSNFEGSVTSVHRDQRSAEQQLSSSDDNDESAEASDQDSTSLELQSTTSPTAEYHEFLTLFDEALLHVQGFSHNGFQRVHNIGHCHNALRTYTTTNSRHLSQKETQSS
ncbi:hypothetical protein GUITHDRAFT_151919 [Guillardia theta CCMP2712]|uniref:RWP-RK domain-containing protein n=1 Tax=Guillardia theta (strain CCMP2712) TaxID=905079 RepID=L1JHU9_GUITC|nr:hypothetical protein GUITHDRAFT_151919 [Guillardia theta CCMP2712]EKX48071.1 hypothetical protein GUITHDRAFT_151919 [Guillardia theta CCMP2712]|eukprot:XP_005835051.1 hypothetical protein GUITHDRAFT_151919 [Guillardia theta CCMP2712]